MRDKRNRRSIVKLLGIGILGEAPICQALAGSETLWPSDEALGSVSQQTSELTTLLNRDDVVVAVKPGTHFVDGPILASGHRVVLRGEVGARLAFTDLRRGGIRFIRSNGCMVRDVELQWGGSGKPPRSHYGAGLLFVRCANPTVINVSVFRAPGGGIQFDECVAASVSNCRVVWSGADGIHFANCHDSVVRDSSCENTGDDCVAIVDYAAKPAGVGFLIERVKVQGSRARGVAIVGGVDGSIVDCEIGSTASNGLHIEQDAHYKTRFPRNVTARNISIAGTGGVLPNVGNQYGVNILRASLVTLDTVRVVGGISVGLSVVSSEDIVLRNTNSAGSRGPAARFIGSTLDLYDVSLLDSGGELLIALDCPRLNGANVKLLRLSTPRSKWMRLLGRQGGSLEIYGLPKEAFNMPTSGLTLIPR